MGMHMMRYMVAIHDSEHPAPDELRELLNMPPRPTSSNSHPSSSTATTSSPNTPPIETEEGIANNLVNETDMLQIARYVSRIIGFANRALTT